MRLPALLRPWTDWLALFPPENAAPLGELLLRLSPMVGPLRRRAVPVAVEPAGIGDIVRRGHYERLLIGEWALLDAAPDEFLRRAGSGELLFTGPEPADNEQSLRSVVLFDAGPSQLGTPRLVHIAMFILLARRAELAGATFEWGVLQAPGTLHAADGTDALRRLLDARTLSVLDQDGLARWDEVLGPAQDDGWVIGDPGALCPAALRSGALVRRSWLGDGLEVALSGQGQRRTIVLPLPAPEDGVRLLRHPFDAPDGTLKTQVPAEVHSLKRPPIFSNQRDWLGVPMADGSVTVYHVPSTPQAKPGRPRNRGKTPMPMDTIVAAGVFTRTFGAVALREGMLYFFGFPGPFFHRHTAPAIAQADPPLFRATPGALHWARAFHLVDQGGAEAVERVLVLDKAGHLACWTRRARAGTHTAPDTTCALQAERVTGAIQHGDRLLYVVGRMQRSDVYAMSAKVQPEQPLVSLPPGARFLFGELPGWGNGGGTYALEREPGVWQVGDSKGAARITLRDGQVVLGCARHASREAPGLVVLEPGRTRITLHLPDNQVTLLESAEPIAQASYDPNQDLLAWLGQKSGTLTVRAIGMATPLLQAVSKRGTGTGGHDAEP